MGKAQRDKGYRGEYNLVKHLKAEGFDAKRIPLSGATAFQKGDVKIEEFIAEVKVRKNGFKQLYRWLEDPDVDLLFIKADYMPYLVVMPLDVFELFLKELIKHD